jgi:NAD(P)-dependent dehydrogenase (short-subunit alcohol dehydrogenase family)
MRNIRNTMNLLDLTGKTALITGASRGLGTQIARALSSAGARVVLTARRVDQLEALASELQNSLAIEMDVSNKESVYMAFEKLEKLGEKIDICVNNAGVALLTSIFDPDDQRDQKGYFERVMQTNVMGVWYVTKQVANHMKNHDIQGSIINIGSVNGDAIPAIVGASYNASKAAVMHMTKGLVGELSPHKIRINAISPGFFKTDMTKETFETYGDALVKKVPLYYEGNLSDIDGAILYLASNKASRYVTGSTITVDGGISWGGI